MLSVNHNLAISAILWLHAQSLKGRLNMVGPVGLEPTTKGFTVPHYFQWERTISSPTTSRLLGCGTL